MRRASEVLQQGRLGFAVRELMPFPVHVYNRLTGVPHRGRWHGYVHPGIDKKPGNSFRILAHKTAEKDRWCSLRPDSAQDQLLFDEAVGLCRRTKSALQAKFWLNTVQPLFCCFFCPIRTGVEGTQANGKKKIANIMPT